MKGAMPFLAPASRQLPSKLSCSVQYPPPLGPVVTLGLFISAILGPAFVCGPTARSTPVLNIVKGERREGAPVSSFPRTTFHPELCPGDALNVV